METLREMLSVLGPSVGGGSCAHVTVRVDGPRLLTLGGHVDHESTKLLL